MSSEARLSDLIRVYDDALDRDLCERIIALFESDPEAQFERGDNATWVEYLITRNPRREWREIERQLVENMLRHVADYARMPAARMLALKAPRAFEHLKIKRYRAGGEHHFPTHVDAFSHKTAVRILAFLWYLNDVDEGGETLFPVLGASIPPRAGRLLVMPPMWMYEHSGEPPRSGDKFIITSYLNFQDPEDNYRFSYPLR